ncbi:MAG: hypothetical protein ABR503_15165, partial [Chitinophagaceae bacterium]
MKHLKHISISITLLLLCAVGLSQIERIDSLKKALRALKDSARIDCLNELSEEYMGSPHCFNLAPARTTTQIDTAEILALQSIEEAEKINYIQGVAEAITLKAALAFNRYNNYSEAGNLAREAIRLYAKTSNKKRLNRAYYELGIALYAQSYFQAAINNLNTSYDLSKKTGDSIYVLSSVHTSAYVYMDCGDYKNAFEKALHIRELLL